MSLQRPVNLCGYYFEFWKRKYNKIPLYFRHISAALACGSFTTPVAHIQQLWKYNTCCSYTTVAEIQHIPWIGLWFWLTWILGTPLYYLLQGIEFGFWIPVCQTVLCLRVNFQGWDTSWAGYRPTAWYLYGLNGVEKCEKVQKSATFFWFWRLRQGGSRA